MIKSQQTLRDYKCHLAEDVIRSNSYLKEDTKIVLEYLKQRHKDHLYQPKEADVILTLGGDGTMLKTIHHYSEMLREDDRHLHKLAASAAMGLERNLGLAANNIFFGFAFGTKNFLMNDYSPDTVSRMLSGQCPIQTAKVKTMLVSVETAQGTEEDILVINDVVISGDAMSWIHFKGTDDENVLGSFEGTGICVSTAVGSTAFNKNNDGVVLPLLSQNLAITGIVTNRKIIEVMHAQEFEISFNSRTNSYIWIDGTGKKLGPFLEGTVKIKPGPWLNLGFFDTHEYQIKRRKAW